MKKLILFCIVAAALVGPASFADCFSECQPWSSCDQYCNWCVTLGSDGCLEWAETTCGGWQECGGCSDWSYWEDVHVNPPSTVNVCSDFPTYYAVAQKQITVSNHYVYRSRTCAGANQTEYVRTYQTSEVCYQQIGSPNSCGYATDPSTPHC